MALHNEACKLALTSNHGQGKSKIAGALSYDQLAGSHNLQVATTWGQEQRYSGQEKGHEESA